MQQLCIATGGDLWRNPRECLLHECRDLPGLLSLALGPLPKNGRDHGPAENHYEECGDNGGCPTMPANRLAQDVPAAVAASGDRFTDQEVSNVAAQFAGGLVAAGGI